jgi:hypothetical protein
MTEVDAFVWHCYLPTVQPIIRQNSDVALLSSGTSGLMPVMVSRSAVRVPRMTRA